MMNKNRRIDQPPSSASPQRRTPSLEQAFGEIDANVPRRDEARSKYRTFLMRSRSRRRIVLIL